MLRASSILKNARLDKELELSEISKKTKIPFRYLEAIEEEKKNSFPQEPYCSLVVKDYADFLGLNGTELLSLFRRDHEPRYKTKTDNHNLVSFTPQFTFVVSVIVFVVGIAGYLSYEYIKFNRPPRLKVNWPAAGIVLGDSIEITGDTDSESTIRVNQDLVIVDQNGSFHKKVPINSNETKVVVESKSPSGKISTQEKVLTATK